MGNPVGLHESVHTLGMYIEPTNENGRRLFERNITGPVVMLNLLRFREIANYTDSPELGPPEPISGREAYQLYMSHTLPFLTGVGGELQFLGTGGPTFIGPVDERWDLVMLVRYPGIEQFLAMAQNSDYLAGIGHRSAALEDSRLIPIEETDRP